MDTLQSQTNSPTNVDDPATLQQKIVEDFFLKDSGSEMIESLNTLIETYLFTENLTHVTPEMREHIVNQLRVTTLIAKLDATNIAKHSPPL
ncbi:hypothetical protein ACN9ML_24625 [Dyadobacter endophyticus]|uniref:hypothetical protein n=1 Tax=Dyadobacter TaxID=120831 RepID=UPI003CF59A9F